MHRLAGLVTIALLASAGSAAAGGVKWKKVKWTCSYPREPTPYKGTYSAPQGWTMSTTAEPPCPRRIRLEAPAGSNAHFEIGTVRAGIALETRARWHLQDAVVTTQGGVTCGEGIAVDWNGVAADPPLRAVRCAKALKGGGVLVASLVGDAALFAKLGGQKAVRSALKAVTGLRVPLDQES